MPCFRGAAGSIPCDAMRNDDSSAKVRIFSGEALLDLVAPAAGDGTGAQ